MRTRSSSRRRHAGTALTLVTIAVLTGCGGQASEAPHEDGEDDGLVRLTPAQAQAAGVETAPAAPGVLRQTLQLDARVERDENAVVHVNPRVSGAVVAIYKGHGEHVEAGEPLAELWSVELGGLVADGLKARTRVQAAEETLEKTRALYARRLETLTRVLDGEIEAAQRILEREKELQQKSISTVRPFLEAERELQRARLARERELATLEAERDAALLELEVELRQARIEQGAARDRLRALGLSEAEIDDLYAADGQYGRLTIRAPREGFVTRRHITQSEHVGPDTVLFQIEDHGLVWVLASVYEQDLAVVREGQKASVRFAALPGATFEGAVDHVEHHVEEDTRAALVRVVLPNREVEGWPGEYLLRPGMFATVEVEVDARQARVVVPEEAVVRGGALTWLFVRVAENTFERRPVEVRPGADDLVEVVTGVEPGEPIAVAGTFALKSLARRGEIGGDHDH